VHQPFKLNVLKVIQDLGVSHMKSRGLIYTLLVIAIFALLFLFLVFGMSPPDAPNETIIRSSGNQNSHTAAKMTCSCSNGPMRI
jgi:hypothetical protein